MKLFLDSAHVEEVREAWSWGIIDGVTTNPSHIAKTGRRFREVVAEICEIVDGPISAEAVSLQADEIVKEAREIASIHPNIVVKVPLIKEGIKALKVLSQEGIRTNLTLCFSANQALLAAKLGATYISPFVGRLDPVAHDGMELVRQIKTILDNYQFPSQIITSAVRHPMHVLEATLAGSHVATMAFDILEQLYDHPLTDSGLKQFLADWEKVPK